MAALVHSNIHICWDLRRETAQVEIMASNVVQLNQDDSTMTLIKGIDPSIDFCPSCGAKLCPFKGGYSINCVSFVISVLCHGCSKKVVIKDYFNNHQKSVLRIADDDIIDEDVSLALKRSALRERKPMSTNKDHEDHDKEPVELTKKVVKEDVEKDTENSDNWYVVQHVDANPLKIKLKAGSQLAGQKGRSSGNCHLSPNESKKHKKKKLRLDKSQMTIIIVKE